MLRGREDTHTAGHIELGMHKQAEHRVKIEPLLGSASAVPAAFIALQPGLCTRPQIIRGSCKHMRHLSSCVLHAANTNH
jgi:hypothetical protein